MVTYLIKSGVCLAIFYLFYKLLLEREPFHVFKRIYLLASIILALTIPLIVFTTEVPVEPATNIPYPFAEIDSFVPEITEKPTVNHWPLILWTIYTLGMLLFGIKFLFNLFEIRNRIIGNMKQKVNRFTHVLLGHLHTPHTFLNYIFLNKQQYLDDRIPPEVFWHEETHARQKHSLDIIFVEILHVVFWFNPMFHFIKRDIRLNHEFLADRAVLNKGVSLSAYQEILLAFSMTSPEPQLANAINYHFLKKRFKLMKAKTSQKLIWFKSLILLPLILVLIYGFSEKVTIKKVTERSTTFDKQKIIKDGIKIHINKDKEVLINNKSIDFNDISNELIKISKEKSHSKSILYIEIDGHLSNTFLDELEREISESSFSVSEIKSTTMTINESDEKSFFKGTTFIADSIVLNLINGKKINSINGKKIIAISQSNNKYQNKATLQEIREYNKLAKKYNSLPKDQRAAPLKDVNRLDLIYHKMTESQKDKAEPFPNFPPPPGQNGATPEMVEEYNDMIRKANQNNNMVLKEREVHRIKYLYGQMSEEQRKSAEPFPRFPPPPPSQNGTKHGQKHNANIPVPDSLKAVKGKYAPPKNSTNLQTGYPIENTNDTLIPPPPPPPVLSKTTIEKGSEKLKQAYNEFSLAASDYARSVRNYKETGQDYASLNDRYRKVLKLHANYRAVAEDENILPSSPPPPPAPSNPVEHLKNLYDNGAIFYFKDKEISLEKATALVKGSNMQIKVLAEGSGRPIVELSEAKN